MEKLLSKQIIAHHFKVTKLSLQDSAHHLKLALNKIAKTNPFLLLSLGDGHNSLGEIPSCKITLGGFGLSHILLRDTG